MHCITTAEEKYSEMEEQDLAADLIQGRREASSGTPVYFGDGS